MTEFIEWEDIVVKESRTGTTKTLCPKCSHTRKKKKDPCLYVNFTSGIAKCYNCDALSFRDNLEQTPQMVYKLPIQTWKNFTELSDNVVKYFEKRKITQSTLKHFKITEEKYFQPALKKEVNNIVFNYFEKDVLINKKYRSASKKFTQSAGTKNMFYNINSIIGEKICYIQEGEIDTMSFHEIGFKNSITPHSKTKKN